MSLETTIQENTSVLRELIAVLAASGALQTAQVSSAAASSPAVKAVVRAQKELEEKSTVSGHTPPAGKPGRAAALSERKPWAEKTAATFVKLQGQPATLDNLKLGIVAINSQVSREQAIAVLARFGVDAVSEKPGKKALEPDQYVDCFGLMLEVLGGGVDATESAAAE